MAEIPDVSKIVEQINKIKIDPKAARSSIHALSAVKGDIIRFYSIAGDICRQINESSEILGKESTDAQKALIESIGKTIDLVSGMTDKKFPSLIDFKIKLWKFKKEISWLLNMFVGSGGVCSILSAFNVKNKTTIDVINDKTGEVTHQEILGTKGASEGFNSINEIVKTVSEIIVVTKNTTGQIIKNYLLIKKGFELLLSDNKKNPGILNYYLLIINSNAVTNLSEKSARDRIHSVNDTVGAVSELISIISSAGAFGNVVSLMIYNSLIVPLAINALNKLSILSQELSMTQISSETTKTLVTVNNLVNQINILIAAISKIGLGDVIKARTALIFINPLLSIIKKVVIKISDFSKSVAKINISGTEKKIVQVNTIIHSLLGLIGSLLLLALSAPAVILAFLPAMGAITVLMLVVWAIAKLSKIISKALSGARGVQTTKGIMVMIGLIGVMLIAGAALLVLGQLGKVFFKGGMWEFALGMFAVVSLVVLAIGAVGYLLGIMVPGLLLFTAGIGLVVLSIGGMLLIGVELNLLAAFHFDEGKKEEVAESTRSIMGAAQAVIDAIFTPADEKETGGGNKFLNALGYFFTGLAEILGLLAAVGKLALTMVAIAFIRLIGSELIWIANFRIPVYDENGNKIGETSGDAGSFSQRVIDNTHIILDTAQMVIDSIFVPADEKETGGGGGFWNAIKHFFSGLVDIIELIVAIGKLALTMVAIAFIRLIGSELNWIADFDTSKLAQVPEKVRQIMRAAQACIDAINQPADSSGGEGGWLKKLLKWVLPDSLVDMIDVMIKIGKLSMMVMAIGMIHKITTQLNDIAGVRFNEKIIRDKVQTIMSCANVCINQVLHGDKLSKPGRKERRRLDDLESFAKFMNKFGSHMSYLANSMANLNPALMQQAVESLTGKITDQNGRSGTFLDLVFSYVDDIAEYKLDQNKYRANMNAVNRLISTIRKMQNIGTGKGLDKYKEGIDKAIQFTNTINNVKLENLQTAANIFEKMAEFSKSISGNFEGLADTINEKIMPLLEQLNEGLNKTNENIENGSFGITGIATATNGSSTTAAPGQNSAPGTAVSVPQKDYSRILGEIKQEISKMQKVLTDGSQVTVIDTH